MIRPALLVLLGGSALIGLAALAIGQTVTPPSGGSGGATSFTLGSTSIPVPGTTTSVSGLTLASPTISGTMTLFGVAVTSVTGTGANVLGTAPTISAPTFTGITTIPNGSISAAGLLSVPNITVGLSSGATPTGEIQLPSNARIYSGVTDTTSPFIQVFNAATNMQIFQSQAGGFAWTTLGITGNVMTLDSTGHLNIINGLSPSIASGACGTGTNGTITGSDQSGVITVGAVATTACAVTFGSTWLVAPKSCVFAAANAAAAGATVLPFISAVSATGFTLSGTALANTAIGFQCL